MSEARWLLDVARAAASDAMLLASALPRLLEVLDERLPHEDGYGRGVLWHLWGLCSLRVDHDLPAATQALNRSLRTLDTRATEASKAYAGRVYDTVGQMLHHQGLLADARRAFERALEHKHAADDEAGVALTEGNLGRLCMELGDFSTAAEALVRDLAYVDATEPDNARLRGQLLTQIGSCRTALGDWKAARGALLESLTLAQSSADPIGLAFATVYLGRLALQQGDGEEARTRAEAAQAHLVELPSFVASELSGLTLQLLAGIEQQEGNLDSALVQFGEASRHFDQAGRLSPVEHAEFLQQHARAYQEAGRDHDAADLLRRALRRLDATTATAMRAQLDARLKTVDEATWVLHSTGRFMGHAQIDQLLSEAGQAGFRGRSEEVTILFSDLRGFTTVTEDLEPAVLIELLNRYLACMTRCVDHFGGMVDKFIGDAVMAVFSLPHRNDDDADRAAAAALYMQAELERFNRSLPATLPALEAGVGVHSGSVVAGLVGSPQKRSYTVIGDVVNTASRLEGMTKQLGVPVLVSREVVDRLKRPAQRLLTPFGRFRPKGRQASIEVFHLRGEPSRGADARAAARVVEQASEALDAFVRRDFERARHLFQAAAETTTAANSEGARGFRLLEASAAAYMMSAPADDWDGAIDLTEK